MISNIFYEVHIAGERIVGFITLQSVRILWTAQHICMFVIKQRKDDLQTDVKKSQLISFY